MAGIYVHIPFCRQKCHYCNFFSLATTHFRLDFLSALLMEIRLRSEELSGQIVETIYFGGGTPSLLTATQIDSILAEIGRWYRISSEPEITLEANPDDLEKMFLLNLHASSVNRLSIGIQSFFDDDLKWLNRIHNGERGFTALNDAMDAGFKNITIDLIYGFPGMTDEKWHSNLDRSISLRIPHISAYAITVEERTILSHLIRKGNILPPIEEAQVKHFRILQSAMKQAGYVHYEISNFCMDGCHSRHNTSYWQGIPYMGFGPSAHSFDGKTRSWNVSSLTNYIKGIMENKPARETEVLTTIDLYNEYIMTGLRTLRGCEREKIRKEFGNGFEEDFISNSAPYLQSGIMLENNGVYTLSEEGMLLADGIASSLFMVG